MQEVTKLYGSGCSCQFGKEMMECEASVNIQGKGADEDDAGWRTGVFVLCVDVRCDGHICQTAAARAAFAGAGAESVALRPYELVVGAASRAKRDGGCLVGGKLEWLGAGAVLCIGGSAPTFVNCVFSLNTSGGLRVTNSRPVVINCRFLTNSTAGNGPGVFATGTNSLVRLSHCTFFENSNGLSTSGQIYATGGAQITV